MGGQLIDGAKRKTAFMVDPATLVVIGHDTSDGPEHHLYDERVKLPLDEGMIASIMSIGVRQSITVEVDGGKALVVEGGRRVLHAREANKRLRKLGDPEIDIPVFASKQDEKTGELLVIALNEIRAEDSTMVKARKAARLLGRGRSHAEVALAFGVTTVTIKAWEDIASAAAPVQRAIDAGQITPTAARKLAQLPKAEQGAAVAQLVAQAAPGKAVKVRDAAKAAKPVDANRLDRPSLKVLRAIANDRNELPDAFVDGVRFALGLDSIAENGKYPKEILAFVKALQKTT